MWEGLRAPLCLQRLPFNTSCFLFHMHTHICSPGKSEEYRWVSFEPPFRIPPLIIAFVYHQTSEVFSDMGSGEVPGVCLSHMINAAGYYLVRRVHGQDRNLRNIQAPFKPPDSHFWVLTYIPSVQLSSGLNAAAHPGAFTGQVKTELWTG